MTESPSRLRVERLVIVESQSPTKFIRDIRLHAGLNIVWAEELTGSKGATEVERAGHGVGKSTFSLMLRAVLGDDGAFVKTMRGHLEEHYGSGGIAAEVVAGDERFAVFRSFGTHSFALKNGTIEGLFEERAKTEALDFSTYVATLGELACLKRMATRALPVTGQPIEWEHVLCWVARDQKLGLREYFEWRKDDGTGLRRKSKDPPALVRLVLGLIADAEASAEEAITVLNDKISTAREALKSEEQRSANTRGIVETQLRTWAGVSSSLQMVTDDLFVDSVETEIHRKTQQLETKNDEDRAETASLDAQLTELAADVKAQDRLVQLAKARWDETIALRNNDEKALEEIRARRDKLFTLSGMCQFGGVAYSDCRHVQEQRDTVRLATQRDIGVLSKAVDEWDGREASEKGKYEETAKVLGKLTADRESKTRRKVALNKAIEARLRQFGESDAVRRTLAQWQESQQSAETERLRGARTTVLDLQKKLEAARGTKVLAQQQISERERQISARFSKLAQEFGVQGRFVASDEKRPFQLVGADGDAYAVLEILLGDLACAEDGADGIQGAHPGFLIFDCPREREMSPHLYERFLTLVNEVCSNAGALQVIVTTTTPPPEPLREAPVCILKLSRASDENLLLRRRIEDLLARAAQSLQDTSNEDDAS